MEIRGGNYFQPALARKALGAGPGEQNVPAVLHHLARGGAPDRSRAAVDGDRTARLHRFFAWPSAEQGWSLEQRSPITPTAWISISMPGRAKLLTVISALPG